MDIINNLTAEQKTELIAKLNEQLEEETEYDVEEEKIKRKIFSQYLKFKDEEDEEYFYNKIKTNKQCLKKIYDKCYKLYNNLQKYKKLNDEIKDKYTKKGYEIDVESYNCVDGEYLLYEKALKKYNRLELFNDFWDYSLDYLNNIIKFSSQQQKSKWKIRLRNMSDTEPEKQLFYLALKFDNETYKYIANTYIIKDIYMTSNIDSYLKKMWDKQDENAKKAIKNPPEIVTDK